MATSFNVRTAANLNVGFVEEMNSWSTVIAGSKSLAATTDRS